MVKLLVLSHLLVFSVIGYLHLKHYRQTLSELWQLRDTLLVKPKLGVDNFCVSKPQTDTCQIQLRINSSNELCSAGLNFKPRRYYHLSLVCHGKIWQTLPRVEVRVLN